MLAMPNPVFISFLLYAFSTAITPGPNNLMTLNTVSRFGLKRSFRMLAGIITGIMIILSVTATLSFVLSRFIPQLTVIAKYLGAIYIVYLSYKIFTSKPISADQTVEEPKFTKGMILQFLNVKIILYAITSLNSFVLPYTSNVMQIVLYALLLTSISVVSLMAWSVLGVLLTDLMQKHYRLINTVLTLILLESVFSLFF
jgi:cysteine/O-acetylserine efflux protein